MSIPFTVPLISEIEFAPIVLARLCLPSFEIHQHKYSDDSRQNQTQTKSMMIRGADVAVVL